MEFEKKDLDRQNLAKLSIPVAMISVSFAAIFVRLSVSGPLSIAMYRMLFATMLLAPVFITRRDEILSLDRKQSMILISTGFFLALHFAAWITSLSYTSVVSSVVLVSSHPLIVTWISSKYLGEKSSREAYYAIFLALGGIIIMAFSNYQAQGWSILGDILAIIGMLAFAGYIIRGRQMRKNISTVVYSTVVYGTASIFLFLIMLPFTSPFTVYPRREYLLFFLLALIPTIFGHTLYNWALKFVRARNVSTSLLAEPVGASLLALVILYEVPPLLTVLGASVTLAGVYWCSKSK